MASITGDGSTIDDACHQLQDWDTRMPQDVKGTSKQAQGQMITFTPVKHGRDKGLWACSECRVAFLDDWMVKHVNWHWRKGYFSS